MSLSESFVEMWDQFRDVIDNETNRFDSTWRSRRRILNTKIVIAFIFQLVLSKGKTGYATILSLVWKNMAESSNDYIPTKPVSASSICEARQKVSDEIFANIQKKVISIWEQQYEGKFLWQGHRVFSVDGSKLNVPRELLEEGYKVECDKAHYPIGLLSCLYRAGCGIPYAWNFSADKNERGACQDLLKHMREGDIVILDRGYYSFRLLVECKSRGIIPVFRLSSTHLKNQRKGRKGNNYIVSVKPDKKVIAAVKKGELNIDLAPVDVRVVNYVINGTEISLGTCLLDEKYLAQDIAELYWARWGEEELYKVSKDIIEVDEFHSKSELGVKQELGAHFVILTFARITAIESEFELNSHQQANSFKKNANFSSRSKANQ